MRLSTLAIALGAALGALLRWVLGALLRWVLGTQLNSLFPSLPPGTLVANLVGGSLIGVALAFVASHPDLPPAWRLFIVTGFQGGLTTFSTFSPDGPQRPPSASAVSERQPGVNRGQTTPY